MTGTLIIPGYRGSEAEHWQRHWANDNPDAAVVEQADWERPVLAEWLAVLEARLAKAPGALLVAHSLGCVLVAHLAQRPCATLVRGALLVAPADVDELSATFQDFASFAPMPQKPLPFPAMVVASRNDPFMTFGCAKKLARSWSAGLVDLGRCGHINVASGFGPWPEGVVLASALGGRRGAAATGKRFSKAEPADEYRGQNAIPA